MIGKTLYDKVYLFFLILDKNHQENHLGLQFSLWEKFWLKFQFCKGFGRILFSVSSCVSFGSLCVSSSLFCDLIYWHLVIYRSYSFISIRSLLMSSFLIWLIWVLSFFLVSLAEDLSIADTFKDQLWFPWFFCCLYIFCVYLCSNLFFF